MYGRWGINIIFSEAGRCSLPLYTGQSPDTIRNKDDFPHPLGPDTSTCCPGDTWSIEYICIFFELTFVRSSIELNQEPLK